MTAAGQDGYTDTVCVTYPSVVRVHVTEFRRGKSCTNCEAFITYNAGSLFACFGDISTEGGRQNSILQQIALNCMAVSHYRL